MSENYDPAPADDHVPARGFPPAEFEARLSRAQTAMAAAGLDGLLLTTEAEFRYFTGFLSRFWLSPTRPWFLLVPASGNPVAVVPSIGRACLQATWLDDVRCWESPQPQDEGVSALADALRELFGPNARIGMPEGPETHLRMPLGDYRRLQAQLPGIAFADATGVIKSLRMIKSPAEVEKIARACTIVSDVFEALPEMLVAGMSEIEIFRRFKIACLERGIDDVDYLVGGAGPGGYTDIISPPSPRPVRAGDILMLDTGAVFDGYFCDFDRNFAFGHVPEHAGKAYRVLLDAAEAGLQAARPDATCAELHRAMQGVIDAEFAGGSGVGRMGHGLGMQLTEWPSITPDDHTVLQPGMVLTLEPSLDLAAGRMMVHEENLVVTADGAKLLTRPAPQSMPVIPA
ncbi:M24 family metallopeptidase [Hoeflea ulvae]|uniref:Xaa-Pro peptidase family protein n=1 Tax=Hoeflea ulvae TaxID=2983764 RepID=A0ABT3YGF8_9HYPH|nr:Xaa-Pro peptidase family protein [Hoeflea ulvae]MCY0094963.1 Xaa-Pro peptidase family protein [Hoeflea ulvae]